MVEIITGVLLLIAGVFNLVAAFGLIRFPDVYTRMHAASKAGTLGAGLMFITVAVASGELDVITRAIAAVIFFLLTAPVSAHLLARAAYCSGYRPWSGTHIDDLQGQYQRQTLSLASVAPKSRNIEKV